MYKIALIAGATCSEIRGYQRYPAVIPATFGRSILVRERIRGIRRSPRFYDPLSKLAVSGMPKIYGENILLKKK
jgi:hypothetical protein